MTFDQIFERLYGHEGGFTKDANDKGNWTGGRCGSGQLKGTKFGISAAAYPTVDIENLTIEAAKAIYRRDYWDGPRIAQLPAAIQFDIFDMAVNSGVGNAIRTLQRTLGVHEDGVLGPITLQAAGRANGYLLVARFNGFRLAFLTTADAWATYGRGWANRVASNLKALGDAA